MESCRLIHVTGGGGGVSREDSRQTNNARLAKSEGSRLTFIATITILLHNLSIMKAQLRCFSDPSLASMFQPGDYRNMTRPMRDEPFQQVNQSHPPPLQLSPSPAEVGQVSTQVPQQPSGRHLPAGRAIARLIQRHHFSAVCRTTYTYSDVTDRAENTVGKHREAYANLCI